MSKLLYEVIIRELTDKQIAELVSVSGVSSADHVMPYKLYVALREYCDKLEIEIPKLYTDVDSQEVNTLFMRDGLRWQIAECAGLYFGKE